MPFSPLTVASQKPCFCKSSTGFARVPHTNILMTLDTICQCVYIILQTLFIPVIEVENHWTMEFVGSSSLNQYGWM